MRRLGLLAAVVAVVATAPGAWAADVPAYGTIVITDSGLGPRATWTYDGVLDCGFRVEGPAGLASRVTVTCEAPPEGSLVTLTCPLMILTRTSVGLVGARAECSSALDVGVGAGTATGQRNLGRVTDAIVCEAYVALGVLVPPYTVTCTEPGLPGVTALAGVA